MGHKNLKGTVTIANYKNRIRLRWRFQSKRYSVNLFHYSKSNLLQAKKIAIIIEQDMAGSQFDYSLKKYKGNACEVEQAKVFFNENIQRSIVEYFEEWTSNYKQMDCNKHCNYNQVRNMLKKWGGINQGNLLLKLNTVKIGERTYNRRLSMLKQFCDWLVKGSIWEVNPLDDVNTKRCKKEERNERKPFTHDEIKRILYAFKSDTFCPAASRFKHSHYYPFIYFIFKTGVRNAEAIGLRVKSVDFDKRLILIKEVLARTLKGYNSAARVRKETKNGKVRSLLLQLTWKKC